MFAYAAADILASERKILPTLKDPDMLMKQVGAAVAYAADTILHRGTLHRGTLHRDTHTYSCSVAGAPVQARRAHLGVGPGGNGGDALYAGIELIRKGWEVTATLVTGHAHPPALQAYLAAGGTLWEPGQAAHTSPASPTPGPTGLLIDGVAGLNSTPGRTWHPQDPALAHWPRLSIDVPTGMCPDTGSWGNAHPTPALLTIAPGVLRAGPLYTPDAGLVLLVPLTVDGHTLTYEDCTPVGRAFTTRPQSEPLPHGLAIPGPPRFGSPQATPPQATSPQAAPLHLDMTPHPWDHPAHAHKYTTGVATLIAGSDTYPGAGLLSTAAAVATGAGMIRYVSTPTCRAHVIAAHPEVVAYPTVQQALSPAQPADVVAIGPGLDASHAATAIREVLAGSTTRPSHHPQVLVLDAGALSALATEPDLLPALDAAVQDHDLHVVLTPHEGEFGRLFPRQASWGRGHWVQEFIRQHPFTVLLKGRPTVIAAAGQIPLSVDPGHSYAATAGTGDVLTGVLAGLLARHTATHLATHLATHRASCPADALTQVVAFAVAAHARAAELSALTPAGYGPTSAGRLTTALPTALADLA